MVPNFYLYLHLIVLNICVFADGLPCTAYITVWISAVCLIGIDIYPFLDRMMCMCVIWALRPVFLHRMG